MEGAARERGCGYFSPDCAIDGCDLIWMRVELHSRLSECSIAFNRRQRHLRFEARYVVPARSSANGPF
jgi:hypothetical protein